MDIFEQYRVNDKLGIFPAIRVQYEQRKIVNKKPEITKKFGDIIYSCGLNYDNKILFIVEDDNGYRESITEDKILRIIE